MVHCFIKSCNSLLNDENITFHRLPSELVLRKLWITAIGYENCEPIKGARICSKHFDAYCLQKTEKSTFLRPGSVPKLFLQKKSTEAKTKKDAIISLHTVGDSPRAQKLKQDIFLLRKKSKADGIKIKCIQNKIRRILRKKEINNKKASTSDHVLKTLKGTNSTDEADSDDSIESMLHSPKASSVERINFEINLGTETVIKPEPTHKEEIVAGISAASSDAMSGLDEDMIQEIKIEQKYEDPLADV